MSFCFGNLIQHSCFLGHFISQNTHEKLTRPINKIRVGVKFPVCLESEIKAGPGQAGWFPLENTRCCLVRAVRENRVRRLFIRLQWSKCLA